MTLLLIPVVLAFNANAPTAELNDPSAAAVPTVLTIAAAPTAVFRVPSTLNSRAAAPTPVFASALLKSSVPAPAPVLKLAAVLNRSEFQPNAQFAAPAVLKAEFKPSHVVNRPPQAAGSGVVCALGANAS